MSKPKLQAVRSADLKIEYVDIRDCKPRKGNPRKHPPRQIRYLADNFKRLGFNVPILIDEDGVIIAGHGRLLAAEKIGLKRIPVIRLSGLSPSEIKAMVLADNRLGELSDWDRSLLISEVEELLQLDPDINFDFVGFEGAEIEALLNERTVPSDPTHDDVPECQERAISRLEDTWSMGPHRLHCGNARDAKAYEALMQGEKAQLIFTDPPYNVKIQGHVSGKGKVKHREFVAGSGELTESEFLDFLMSTMSLCAFNSANGSCHEFFIDWRHVETMLRAGREVYGQLLNICVWKKTNGSMGFYRSQHELVCIFKYGKAKHINNFQLGQHGRHRTNVWEYAGANSFGADRMDDLSMHPTVKPVALIADAIRDCSRKGAIILDPFCGSGSTIIAAEITGRRGYAIELDPLYVDVAVRRWQKLTGETATLEKSGKSFDVVARVRAKAVS